MPETCAICSRPISDGEMPCIVGDQITCLACHDRHWLIVAADAGATVRIVYLAGTQPGTVRDVSPLSFTKTQMKACDANGMEKTYNLRHVRLAIESAPASEYLARTFQESEDRPLGELLQNCASLLRSRGWHVEVEADSIGVYRLWKNGNPKKTPVVFFSYDGSPVDSAESLTITISAFPPTDGGDNTQ